MNNKIFGYLSGKCSIHGARTHPVKGWGPKTICEVTAESAHNRRDKWFKKYMRRQARRRDWFLEVGGRNGTE